MGVKHRHSSRPKSNIHPTRAVFGELGEDLIAVRAAAQMQQGFADFRHERVHPAGAAGRSTVYWIKNRRHDETLCRSARR